MLEALGDDKDKLVIDLSCRRKGDTWFVAMNKWQTLTDMELTRGKFKQEISFPGGDGVGNGRWVC